LTPKESQTNKLKKYRQQKSDEYAQAIMSTPRKVSLYSTIPYPGVVMIMGDIRTGKTGLAHEIANQMHSRRNASHTPYAPDGRKTKKIPTTHCPVLDESNNKEKPVEGPGSSNL